VKNFRDSQDKSGLKARAKLNSLGLEKGSNMQYFDDFQVGAKTVTRGRTITEADIVNFAGCSGDWYSLHTDAEFARTTPFRERIAHGMLVLSVATGLMPLDDMAIVAFYGRDKVRFTSPTKIGDTLHVKMEVTDKQDKGEFGIVSLKQVIKNQKDKDVVVSTLKVVIAKAPPLQP
jgi:acyl dehydratase